MKIHCCFNHIWWLWQSLLSSAAWCDLAGFCSGHSSSLLFCKSSFYMWPQSSDLLQVPRLSARQFVPRISFYLFIHFICKEHFTEWHVNTHCCWFPDNSSCCLKYSCLSFKHFILNASEFQFINEVGKTHQSFKRRTVSLRCNNFFGLHIKLWVKMKLRFGTRGDKEGA